MGERRIPRAERAQEPASILICSAAVRTSEGHDLNLGDEAISAALEIAIRARDDRVRVVRTVNTRRAAMSVETGRVDTSVASLLREMRRTDVAVLGGGTLIQNDRGLALYCAKVALASALTRTKLVIVAVGVEEVPRVLRPLFALALRRATSVSVRDHGSAKLLSTWANDPTVTADPLFLRDVRPLIPHTQRVDDCALSLRPDAPQRLIANLGVALHRAGIAAPIAVATDQRIGHDEEALRRLFAQARYEWHSLPRGATWEECLAAIAGADRCVAMRLHACIFAAISGRPVTVLARDNKTRSVAAELGLESLGLDTPVDTLAEAIRHATPVGPETLDALADRAQVAIDQVLAELPSQPG